MNVFWWWGVNASESFPHSHLPRGKFKKKKWQWQTVIYVNPISYIRTRGTTINHLKLMTFYAKEQWLYSKSLSDDWVSHPIPKGDIKLIFRPLVSVIWFIWSWPTVHDHKGDKSYPSHFALSYETNPRSVEGYRPMMPLGRHHLQRAVMQFPAQWIATPTWLCPEILLKHFTNKIGDRYRQKESDLEKEPKDSSCFWRTEAELPWGVTLYPMVPLHLPQEFPREPGHMPSPGPKNTCRLDWQTP